MLQLLLTGRVTPDAATPGKAQTAARARGRGGRPDSLDIWPLFVYSEKGENYIERASDMLQAFI